MFYALKLTALSSRILIAQISAALSKTECAVIITECTIIITGYFYDAMNVQSSLILSIRTLCNKHSCSPRHDCAPWV